MATSLQPYKFKLFKNDNYTFITDSGLEYLCYFTPFGEYFYDYPEIASKIFTFNISLKSKHAKPKGTDNRIADTVVKIVGDFLVSRINAVVYVCDPSDGKGAARSKKFKSWFNYYEHDSIQIQQVNSCLEVGNEKLHTALLVHRKNKLKNKFVEAYLSLTDGDK